MDAGTDSALFAERLLQLIDEGRRTATYKLALLLALIDGCSEHADASGAAPNELHTRTVAAAVVRRYLPQVRRFLALDGREHELRQITMKQSAALNAVLRLQAATDAADARTAERRDPGAYERCLDEVERTFARYPLRLLQNVGNERRPFLYTIDWGESVSLTTLHSPGGGRVRFLPGAADRLLALAPLIRPLVELHWVRMVASINRLAVEDERLHAHLFGADRLAFPRELRSGLVELQDGRCFYCRDGLRSRIDVDHFLPWSRWPTNAIENLVVADRCNNAKRDHLAAGCHVEAWAARVERRGADLVELARRTGWESNPARSLALVRSCYAHLPPETPLWVGADRFVAAEPQSIATRLASVTIP